MSESQHQRALIEWASRTRLPAHICTAHGLTAHHRVADFLIVSANGSKRSRITGAMLKADGVRAGIPDLHLALPSDGRPGLWIELKADKGRLSAPQKVWLDRLRGVGYVTACCHGWDEARACIEDYLA